MTLLICSSPNPAGARAVAEWLPFHLLHLCALCVLKPFGFAFATLGLCVFNPEWSAGAGELPSGSAERGALQTGALP
jgi:hypothetical protein